MLVDHIFPCEEGVGVSLLREILDRPLLLTLFQSNELKLGKALDTEGKIRWDQA